ncbi:uncharacterized protein LOC112088554 [Eutrema salsugineum]|uniref:uncharacterized protein LOC112088554 n=1 Tax=Eutrema salsugineum TaxID=72664 RepID=UPI000CED5D60|nr:uncharacterized protein LOC112088554 [Eutrema salsugineum]
MYEWDVSIEHLVKANFDALAATCLRGMVSFAKSNGVKPDWILSSDWLVMLAHWRTPEAKEKSQKAHSSRLFSRDGLGPHGHRSGSCSYAKVQDALEANNEDSSFIAVMKKTHQKSDGTYVDERARVIAEQYDEHVQERLAQMESANGEVLTGALTLEERNEIYIKVAGISKQGRVFGIGSLQSGVSMSFNGSSVLPQTTEEVGTLTRRIEELETDLQKSHDENALFQKRLETVEKLVETLFGQDILTTTTPSSSTPA